MLGCSGSNLSQKFHVCEKLCTFSWWIFRGEKYLLRKIFSNLHFLVMLSRASGPEWKMIHIMCWGELPNSHFTACGRGKCVLACCTILHVGGWFSRGHVYAIRSGSEKYAH